MLLGRLTTNKGTHYDGVTSVQPRGYRKHPQSVVIHFAQGALLQVTIRVSH